MISSYQRFLYKNESFLYNFENNINLFVEVILIITILYYFISSFNISKKICYNYNYITNEYNYLVNRTSYISILLSFISYSQFISLLSFYNINEYPSLLNISKKLDWINLWNINLLQVNNNECTQINFFFQNHFIFIITTIGISIINISLLSLFKFLYKYRIKNNTEFHELYHNDNNIIYMFLNNYILFPYINLIWTNTLISGLIISEILMINNNCKKFLIISLGSFLTITILYFSYFIAFIKNFILSIEDVIYKLDNTNYKNKFKYYNSILNSFNKGYWIIKQDLKYYKSHSYIYIDFKQNKIIYLFFYLFKIFLIGIITGIQPSISNNEKNTNICLNTIWSIYILDVLLLLLFNPYKNIFINFLNVLVNISISVIISLLIFRQNEIYILYIVDSTFIILSIIILFELLSMFVIYISLLL